MVLDVIGGEILERSTALVRPGGTLVTIAEPVTVHPRDGRAVFFVVEPDRARLMAERGMVAPAAVDALAQWDGILAAAAPELTGRARAVKFGADTGRLDVVPDSPAYGTKLRAGAHRS